MSDTEKADHLDRVGAKGQETPDAQVASGRGGLVLLGISLYAAKALGSPSCSLQRAAHPFIPVWFVVALGNILASSAAPKIAGKQY